MNIFQETRSIKNTLYCLLILLFFCLVSFWPLTFHVFSLKNDALNYFLPVRHQVSEAISNGYWPFWSPYFNLGYPLHGDMQSGVWNPFVQIISLFGPYTLKTLQYETLLYIYLSGVGMFFLTDYFCKDSRISLLIGTSFMLCGFNTDSCQFLNWICGASFLPFIFLFYYRTLVENNWKTAIAFSIFLFLLFTTAYPADFILTCYFLLFVFIWHFASKGNRSKKTWYKQSLLHLLIMICFLLLTLPAIISYVEFLPLSERGAGTTYDQAMSNPLHPGLVMSYATPLPTWKAQFAGITDPLERNCFFGLIPFTFFLVSFFIKFPDRVTRFLKWAFVFSLLFSFGEVGGLRILAYYALPLMNTFRHPANERLFTIFLACLLSAFAFQALLNLSVSARSRRAVWSILLAIFAGLTIWAVSGPITIFSLQGGKTIAQVKALLDHLNFYDALLINILIEAPFLIVLYFWFSKKINWSILLIGAMINSTVHALLFQPLTVVKKDKVSFIQGVLNGIKKDGYPQPDLNSTLLNNSQNGMEYFDEIGVSNMYNKKIGRVDYRITPSNLLNQNDFWFHSTTKDILFRYPIFYRADTLVSIGDSSKVLNTSGRMIYVDKNEENPGNTSNYSVVLKHFDPLTWEFEIQSSLPGYYCLFQNYYPRWELFVDGKKQPIQKCNIAFMGIRVNSGKHTVLLKYKTADLKIAFFISLATLIILILLLCLKPVWHFQS